MGKLIELHEKQKIQDREFWKTEEDKRIKQLYEDHRKSLSESKRFNRMMPDIEKFTEKLQKDHRADIDKKTKDFNARLEVERKKRLAERKEQRRQARINDYRNKKKEEEQRRLD